MYAYQSLEVEPFMDINWYPGHMAKAKRLLSDQLGRCDVVIELCDARLPFSSRNPDLARMTNGKKRILLLNKADLADPGITSAWISRFKEQGLDAAPCTAYMNRGKEVLKLIDRAAKEAVEKAALKGVHKTVRVMVAGVPNVGKSTLINALHGSRGRGLAFDRGVLQNQFAGMGGIFGFACADIGLVAGKKKRQKGQKGKFVKYVFHIV